MCAEDSLACLNRFTEHSILFKLREAFQLFREINRVLVIRGDVDKRNLHCCPSSPQFLSERLPEMISLCDDDGVLTRELWRERLLTRRGARVARHREATDGTHE